MYVEGRAAIVLVDESFEAGGEGAVFFGCGVGAFPIAVGIGAGVFGAE